MPPPWVPPEAVVGDPQVAPPYCDLYVQQIVPKVNHDERIVSLRAVIGNRGTAPPSGPMLVEITVLADYYSPQYGYWIQMPFREWRWYHAGTSLPFTTLWTSVPLYYVEDGGGAYQVYVRVGDNDNHPGDINLNNNYGFMQCPATYKPATFNEDMMGVLRQETSLEGGKLKSTMTLDGKPLRQGRKGSR